MLHEHIQRVQWQQYKHDDLFHREIAHLTVLDRMKHMILHLAKYSAIMLESELDGDDTRYDKALIDALIISISSANILSLNLGTKSLDIIDSNSASTLEELGCFLQNYSVSKHSDLFLNLYIINVGKLSKACESVDHLEVYNYKQEMQIEISQIFFNIIKKASSRNIKILDRISDRLDGIHKKHLFANFLTPEFAASSLQNSKV